MGLEDPFAAEKTGSPLIAPAGVDLHASSRLILVWFAGQKAHRSL
jgi:hypothetical protein